MNHYATIEEFNADGFTPRLFTMPAEEYRKIDAVSQSQIKDYLKSPAYWQAVRNGPKEATEAMILGSYFDALLTGDGLESFMVKTWDSRTKEGKALSEQHSDKILISQENAFDVNRWIASVSACSHAQPYLRMHKQICAIGQINGVNVKGRADLFDAESRTIADLKLIADASPDAMAKSLSEGYDIQAALYCELFAQLFGFNGLDFRFVLVCQEKHKFTATGDFTGVYEVAEPDKVAAMTQIKKTIADIETSKAFGVSGYGSQTITARWPRVLK